MYLEELREFQFYLASKTDVAELKKLNLLGVQFALCEASKYFFYLRYKSGPIYKPSSRNFDFTLQEVSGPEVSGRTGRTTTIRKGPPTVTMMTDFIPTTASESGELSLR